MSYLQSSPSAFGGFIADNITIRRPPERLGGTDAELLQAFEDWLAATRGYCDPDGPDDDEELESRFGVHMDEAEDRLAAIPAQTMRGVAAKLRFLFRQIEDSRAASRAILDGIEPQPDAFEPRFTMFWNLIGDVERMAARYEQGDAPRPRQAPRDPLAERILNFSCAAADDDAAEERTREMDALTGKLIFTRGGAVLAREKLRVLSKRLVEQGVDQSEHVESRHDFLLLESALCDLIEEFPDGRRSAQEIAHGPPEEWEQSV